MIQQMQTFCSDCNGEGTTIAESARCKACRGQKTVKEEKVLEVYVNKGMRSGETIVFKGEADQAPDTIPGDVVVKLEQKPHPLFKREGPHLFYKKKISLMEALTGFRFPLKHLDERVLMVCSTAREVVTPGDVKAVRDEGMPLPKHPMQRGNLYVVLDVEFPQYADIAPHVAALKSILPSLPSKDMDVESPVGADTEEVTLVTVNLEEEQKRFQEAHGREAYHDDDEEHGGHGQNVRACRAQ